MHYRARALGPVVDECLRHFPAVVLTGARQTGKTTLVQHLESSHDRHFLTLDNLRVLDQARNEPDLLIREAERVTLDEVQRARTCSERSSAASMRGEKQGDSCSRALRT